MSSLLSEKTREISDYIHLYHPQSRLRVEISSTGEIGTFEGITSSMVVFVHVNGRIKDVDVNDIKPFLRPLSSMTEEEAVEFIHRKHRSLLTNIDRTEITKVSFGATKNIINFSYFRRRGAGAEAGGNTYYVNQSDPEQFQYLLSKGFDLFGLIEKGLALSSSNEKSELKEGTGV